MDVLGEDVEATVTEMTIVTKEDLRCALVEEGGLEPDEAERDAEFVLDLFGFDDRVLDARLEPEDRHLFYMLEEWGFVTTEVETIQLDDGSTQERRFWVLRKDAIVGHTQGPRPVLEIHPRHRERRFTLRGIFRDEGQAVERAQGIRADETPHAAVFGQEAPSGTELFHLVARNDVEASYDVDLPAAGDALDEAVRIGVWLFTTLAQRAERQGRPVPWYKDLETDRLRTTADRWDWAGTHAEVAADILSKTIRAHPFPNANHRTSLMLARSYLHAAGIPWPDPSDGDWHEYGSEVHDVLGQRIAESKYLLLLRRRKPMVEIAFEEGYRYVALAGAAVSIDAADLELGRAGLQERHRELCGSLIRDGAAPELEEDLGSKNDLGLRDWVQFAQN